MNCSTLSGSAVQCSAIMMKKEEEEEDPIHHTTDSSSSSSNSDPLSVGIIGAGFGGLVVANYLETCPGTGPSSTATVGETRRRSGINTPTTNRRCPRRCPHSRIQYQIFDAKPRTTNATTPQIIGTIHLPAAHHVLHAVQLFDDAVTGSLVCRPATTTTGRPRGAAVVPPPAPPEPEQDTVVFPRLQTAAMAVARKMTKRQDAAANDDNDVDDDTSIANTEMDGNRNSNSNNNTTRSRSINTNNKNNFTDADADTTEDDEGSSWLRYLDVDVEVYNDVARAPFLTLLQHNIPATQFQSSQRVVDIISHNSSSSGSSSTHKDDARTGTHHPSRNTTRQYSIVTENTEEHDSRNHQDARHNTHTTSSSSSRQQQQQHHGPFDIIVVANGLDFNTSLQSKTQQLQQTLQNIAVVASSAASSSSLSSSVSSSSATNTNIVFIGDCGYQYHRKWYDIDWFGYKRRSCGANTAITEGLHIGRRILHYQQQQQQQQYTANDNNTNNSHRSWVEEDNTTAHTTERDPPSPSRRTGSTTSRWIPNNRKTKHWGGAGRVLLFLLVPILFATTVYPWFVATLLAPENGHTKRGP